jgi:hypothetical protein
LVTWTASIIVQQGYPAKLSWRWQEFRAATHIKPCFVFGVQALQMFQELGSLWSCHVARAKAVARRFSRYIGGGAG